MQSHRAQARHKSSAEQQLAKISNQGFKRMEIYLNKLTRLRSGSPFPALSMDDLPKYVASYIEQKEKLDTFFNGMKQAILQHKDLSSTVITHAERMLAALQNKQPECTIEKRIDESVKLHLEAQNELFQKVAEKQSAAVNLCLFFKTANNQAKHKRTAVEAFKDERARLREIGKQTPSKRIKGNDASSIVSNNNHHHHSNLTLTDITDTEGTRMHLRNGIK